MTINPRDAKPGEVFRATVDYGDGRVVRDRTIIRRPDHSVMHPWLIADSHRVGHDQVSDLVRLVPEQDRADWDVLREASHIAGEEADDDRLGERIADLADVVERRHNEAVAERAEAAARDDLIERLSGIAQETARRSMDLIATSFGMDLADVTGIDFRSIVEKFVDDAAGLLSAPTTDDDEVERCVSLFMPAGNRIVTMRCSLPAGHVGPHQAKETDK